MGHPQPAFRLRTTARVIVAVRWHEVVEANAASATASSPRELTLPTQSGQPTSPLCCHKAVTQLVREQCRK